MRRSLLAIGFIAIIIISINLNGCAGSPSPTREDFLYPHVTISNDDQHIAFAYRKNNITSIYTASIDGTNVRQLTHPQNEDHVKPVFSPDGSKLLFLSFSLSSEKPSGKINILELDGKNIRQIPFDKGNVTEAIFSPDGKKIYFINSTVYTHYSPFVSRASHGFDIYSMTVDGEDIKQLTNKNEYAMSDLYVFSDGKTLLYQEDIDKVYAKDEEGHTIPIYTFHFLSLDSNKITYLRPKGNFVSTFEYALSSDDKFVAFVADDKSTPEHQFELYLMNLETDQIKQVTRFGPHIEKPRFFHKQEKLLFMQVTYASGSGRQSKYELMQINTDGSNLTKVDLEFPEDNSNQSRELVK